MRPRIRRADQYDDPDFNYVSYWRERHYEHAAEELAIRRLLRGRHFTNAVDVGGGYGRLSVVLAQYADNVTLADPSRQQLGLAARYLADHPRIARELMQADDLAFADRSVDLVLMVRVMHHLPDPRGAFAEIARVLAPGGCAIIEVANYLHMRNRIKHLVRGKRLPVEPVDVRSPGNRRSDTVSFVNHNPHTVARQLADAGLEARVALSVSNLRIPGMKKLIPHPAMLAVERMLQRPMAKIHFGPSIFFIAQKPPAPWDSRHEIRVRRLKKDSASVR